MRLMLLAPGRAALVLVKGRHVIQTKALGRSCGLIPLAGPAQCVPPCPQPADICLPTFAQLMLAARRTARSKASWCAWPPARTCHACLACRLWPACCCIATAVHLPQLRICVFIRVVVH